jgi:arylsulfatase A-like enzyme
VESELHPYRLHSRILPMPEKETNGRRLFRAGARGVAVWAVYGAVEFALCYDYPLIFDARRIVSPWAWPLMATVFLAYAGIEAVSGIFAACLAAWISKAKQAEPPSGWIQATFLALAFAVNLIPAFPLARSEYVALGIDGLLIAGLVAGIRSERWRLRLSGLQSPWTVSLVLLAAPWMSREALHDASGGIKLCASLGMAAVVAAAGLGLGRRRRAWGGALGLAAITAIVGVSWIANRGPSRLPHRGAAAPPGGPNVVLITLDAVRADHLSVDGYDRDTTPNLRALARRATVYTRAIASADMTLPTHASLFTGVYASWHGAHYAPPAHPYGRPLDKRYATLAGILSAKGYTTAAVVANYAYLQPDLGLDRGFQAFDSRVPVTVTDEERPFFLRQGIRSLLRMFFCTAEFDLVTRRADEINSDALERIDEARQAGRPFFLFLNYMDAHTPYVPPAPFDKLFPGKRGDFSFAEYLKLQRQVLAGKRAVSDDERRHFISQYDGGIAYIDAAIGKLMSAFEARGIFSNTLVVIVGDHGEAFGERGLLEHAVASVYQDQVHVPLVIKYPAGMEEPHVSAELVTQLDVLPTILEVAGCRVPDRVQGRSLRGASRADRLVISEAFPTPFRPLLERAAFLGEHKLINSSTGQREYFNLAQDPGEERSRYQSGDPDSIKLQAQLEDWIRKIPKPSGPAPGLGNGALQRLKSLGYVQ